MLVGILMLITVPSAHAVNPDEVLADPALEKRARELSTHLRCLVCQNQTIDDSDADLARDLRLLVRERLTAGDDDNQVLEYLVARYGEFILLNPRLSVSTYLLWGTPIALILIGGFVLIRSMRKRSKRKVVPLTKEEQAALAKILDDRDQPA
jgi:cytochrome c-type biogenesis protein CcmH